jgi:arylsulfatase
MSLSRLILLGFAILSSATLGSPPNVIFILADDLGYGDIGAFGQAKIRTPNLDRLAATGMKLNSHYAGANVCAPSRCTLLSGKHQGHAYIRENRGGLGEDAEGQEPVPAGELTLPLTLKKLGYAIGCVGKWGLGPVGSSGDPLNQGFDRFFGYNCQAQAHNFYPTHLWSNREKVALQNPKFAAHQKLPAGADPNDPASYAPFSGKQYSSDLIGEEALAFVRQNKDIPFFLYYATTIPHLALQVPEDSLKEYEGAFPEEPYPAGMVISPTELPRRICRDGDATGPRNWPTREPGEGTRAQRKHDRHLHQRQRPAL